MATARRTTRTQTPAQASYEIIMEQAQFDSNTFTAPKKPHDLSRYPTLNREQYFRKVIQATDNATQATAATKTNFLVSRFDYDNILNEANGKIVKLYDARRGFSHPFTLEHMNVFSS